MLGSSLRPIYVVQIPEQEKKCEIPTFFSNHDNSLPVNKMRSDVQSKESIIEPVRPFPGSKRRLEPQPKDGPSRAGASRVLGL